MLGKLLIIVAYYEINCKITQKSCFAYEYQCLKQGKLLSKRHNLAALDPFMDDKDLIRLVVRLQKSLINYSSWHPIILP